MKNRNLLLPLLFCYGSLLYSQTNDDYLSKINLDDVQSKSDIKQKKLLAKYTFPKSYEKTLEINIVEFEYNKAATRQKFTDDTLIKQQKLDSLTSAFEIWRENQIQLYESAVKKWNNVFLKHDLDEHTFKETYLDYHFYISLPNPTESEAQRIQEFVEHKALKKLINEMAKNETIRVVSKCSALEKLDSIAIKHGREALYQHLKSKTLQKLQVKSTLNIRRDSDQYCDYVFEAANQKQEEINALKLEQKNKAFITKAIEIGLTEAKTNAILALIEIRKNDLESLKNASNNSDDMSNLFENTDPRTKTEIKRAFSKNLASIISKSQFAKLFGDEFIGIAQNKTQDKLFQLKDSYEFEETEEHALYKLINNFYFNEQVSVAYYSFDKKLKKQKLSALRYHFEKDYKKLMNEYGHQISPVKQMDKRTYEWD